MRFVTSLCIGSLWVGCHPAEPPVVDETSVSTQGAPSFTVVEGPTATVQPPPVHLAWWIDVSTDAPTTLTLLIDDGERVREVAFPASTLQHHVPVFGLKANRSYTITAVLSAAEGVRTVPVLGVHNGSLPFPFPDIELLTQDVDRMEPGYRMVALDSLGGAIDALAVFDADMDPVWVYKGSPQFGDVRLTERNTLLGMSFWSLVELDWMGNELWNGFGLGTPPLHHEAYALADGGFLSLAYVSPIVVAAHPTQYEEPAVDMAPAVLANESVVLLDAHGQVLSRWPLSQRLDKTRFGFDGLTPASDGLDWLHTNGVIPSPTGGVVVSSRHQNALVKLDDAGDLVWILGDPAGWSPAFQPYLLQPVGALQWPYHQHAPEFTDDGLLVVFDNHNDGHTPYTPAPLTVETSRAVAFRIDEVAGTVEQVWELGRDLPGRLYSSALGDADVLPQTGNVLLDFGFLDGEDGVLNIDVGLGNRSIRLVEMHPDRPNDAVLDVRFTTQFAAHPFGVKAYRAEHIPSFYGADAVERWLVAGR